MAGLAWPIWDLGIGSRESMEWMDGEATQIVTWDMHACLIAPDIYVPWSMELQKDDEVASPTDGELTQLFLRSVAQVVLHPLGSWH